MENEQWKILGDCRRMINLGYLRHNDMFKFENETYRVGHTDGQGLGWVICTNVKTNKIKKIHIDSPVEVVKEKNK